MSRGGYAAWRMAMQYPEKFAALVAICGVAPTFYSRWLRDMPVWVFHGEDDGTIPVSESDKIVEEMRNRGQNVKYTRYPNTNHDSWTETFNNPELYEWLLKQSLSKKHDNNHN